MAERRPRGSIIYEALIVLLTAALIGSIAYPKKLWDQMDRETEICRSRMSAIFDGELQYQKFYTHYTDSLPELVTFLKSDSAYLATIDSVIVQPIRRILADLDTLVMRQRAILEAVKLDTSQAARDSLANLEQNILADYRFTRADLEDVLETMKSYPMMPRQELKEVWVLLGTEEYITQLSIAQNMLRLGEIDLATQAAERYIAAVEAIEPLAEDVIRRIWNTGPLLDEIYTCPAVQDTYRLVLVDTSGFTYINIYCPIDSADIEAVKRDFLRYRIGGYRLENHGKVENGVKSWEAQS